MGIQMRSLFVVLALCAVSPARAQFEGVVESTNATIDETGTAQRFTMTIWLRKGMARVDIPPFGGTPGSIAIYRQDRRVIWMLDPGAKSYFEIKIDEKDSSGGTHAGATDASPLKRSGKTRKILTYPCDQFVGRSPEVETEIWATASLKHLARALTETLGDESMGAGWNDEVSRMGLFPMVSIIRSEGQVIESSEVTRVESVIVPAATFELPAEYRRQVVEQPVK
jgi:hypothetical protein